jgi:uncharacterized protein YecE (DUF72 family)
MKLGMCGFTIGAAAYFRQFPVVEIQQTFYDPPPVERLARWRDQAPAGFEFTMKAWQVITHLGESPTYRRLRRPMTADQRADAGAFRLNDTTLAAWDATLAARDALGATAILLQCPASFRPTPDNIAAMQLFLRGIDRPSRMRLLWEPRGKWPDETVSALCEELDLVHAVDPFVRPSLTPGLLYWRLHGNKNHYARYSDDELRQLIGWLPTDSRVECYVLFNNIPRMKDVQRFRELLAGGPG